MAHLNLNLRLRRRDGFAHCYRISLAETELVPSDVPSTRPCVLPAERDTISNAANGGASGQGQLMSTDHQD